MTRHARILIGGALACAAFGGTAVAASACRYDPVPQDVIDGLGDEAGEPNGEHRPGQPCLACHANYEGADPEMAVGGTIYYEDSDGRILPAPNVLVEVIDSRQVERQACTNKAGNFWIEEGKWKDITFPLSVRAGSRRMISLVGRDGSCAACHTLPDDASLDGVTGAGRASAGVVVVSEADLGAVCATDPTTTSSSSSSGGGAGGEGAGGAPSGSGGGGGGSTTSGAGGAGGAGGAPGAGGGGGA